MPKACFAQTIYINNVKYETTSTIKGENFVFDSTQSRLVLENAHLKTIRSDVGLKIDLRGENYLDANDDAAIKATYLQIDGSGVLNITNNNYGLKANKITINNTNLNIKTGKSAIFLTNSSWHS